MARTYYALSTPKKHRKHHERQRRKILMFLGGKCSRCALEDWHLLEIDHINGGGTQHRKKRNVSQRYKDILATPSEYQLLCANCHTLKSYENGEFGADFTGAGGLVTDASEDVCC